LEQFNQNLVLPKDLENNLESKTVESLTTQIKFVATQAQSDPLELLHILRVLEELHSDICNDLFQPALPNSRHALFDILRDIETKGGWPHIYRRNLYQLFGHLNAIAAEPALTLPESDPQL
jgi:hypothetical protein